MTSSAKLLEVMLGPVLEFADRSTVNTVEYVASAPGTILLVAASWCPFCASFTPKLKEYMKTRPQYQVILVPSEDNEASYREYHQTMPWAAVPFQRGHSIVSPRIMEHYEFMGFPSAAAVDANGNLLTRNVTTLVRQGQELPDPR